MLLLSRLDTSSEICQRHGTKQKHAYDRFSHVLNSYDPFVFFLRRENHSLHSTASLRHYVMTFMRCKQAWKKFSLSSLLQAWSDARYRSAIKGEMTSWLCRFLKPGSTGELRASYRYRFLYFDTEFPQVSEKNTKYWEQT